MTQLLISVKNLEESRIARYANADVIDLKDPSVGALGALDIDVVSQIVQDVSGRVLLSATVGEGHATIDVLKQDIILYAGLGVDVVKIAVSELFQLADFFSEIKQLTKQGIKLVAVFFANEPLDFSLLTKLKDSGFYGAMLDTQLKNTSLLELQTTETLQKFIVVCKQHMLISGLAGSINMTHIDRLLMLNSSFIGMRGGVCHGRDRVSTLVGDRVVEVKTMLLNYNNRLEPLKI
jgi:(5-formylfuran-3-yl)methyl phosphate synthase